MNCNNITFPNEPSFFVGTPSGGGEANTMSNIGGGVELFKIKNLLDLQLRTLVAGDGMSISLSGDTVVFESTGGLSNGTATGNTLRWDGTNWAENNTIRNFNTYVGINTNGNSYTALTISDSAIPGGIFGLDIDSHNPVGMRMTLNKDSDVSAIGLGIQPATANYTGLMLQINDTVGKTTINHQGKITALDLQTTTPHPALYHSLFVNAATGLIYSQAVPSGGGGTITGAENVGAGDGWWKDESSGSLRFKSLTTDSSIDVVSNADDLNLSVANPLPTGLTEQTLRHDGTNWIANSLLRNNGTNVRLNGALNSSRVFTVTDSGSSCLVPVKITGTKTTALEVEITTGSLSGAKALDIQSTNASFNGNYINILNTSTGLKFKVDSEGAVTSDYLTASTAHAASYLGLYVDTATGKIYANTDTPSGGGGGISDGTGTGNMLYWNGSAWTENANVQIDGSTFRLKSGYDLVIDDAAEIILKDADNSNSLTLTVPDVLNADYAIQLPADAPALGQVVRISNASSGATEWVDLPEIIKVTVTTDLPQINVGSTYQAFWTVTGAQLGGTVAVSPQNGLGADIIISYARVSSTNNIEVRFANIGSTNVDLTSRDFYITVINP